MSSALSGALLLDRFVSASSATDASDSLNDLLKTDEEQLVELFLAPSPENNNNNNNSTNEGLSALIEIVGGQLNNLTVEEGPALACRILLKLLQKSSSASILLQRPAPGRLIQTLLDLISDSTSILTTNSYTRVIAIQVLEQICFVSPSRAQQQLLEVPNGLHRLAELLVSGDSDEQVRNQILLLLLQIAKWPSCAKILIFADVCDTSLNLALKEGGLTAGSVIVQDCLNLCRSLLQHDPASSADLVLSSSHSFPQSLSQLLDLRGGTEFKNPHAAAAAAAAAEVSKNKKKEQRQPTSSSHANKAGDDLDDILKSVEDSLPLSSNSNDDTKDNQNNSAVTTESSFVPKLTINEEKVLEIVFDILSLLLSTPEHQRTIWKQYPALSSLVWEFALVSPPPPNTTQFPCAMPSCHMQQLALQLTSQVFNDEETMERHNGMERLLYLVCTGGGASCATQTHRLAISQSALTIFRRTMSPESANLVVVHTLVPPALPEESEQQQPQATSVQKLFNTVLENLEAPPPEMMDAAVLGRRHVNLVGALGALGVFLGISDTTREMMLQITSKNNDIDFLDTLLASLEHQNGSIAVALLRFLCEWMSAETPATCSLVVKAILSSTYSTSLGVLFQKKGAENSKLSSLAGLALGLAMNGMGVDDNATTTTTTAASEQFFGGWSKQGILTMISNRKGGISRFTSALESLKENQHQKGMDKADDDDFFPWSACTLEMQVFQTWAKSRVYVVRKRVVEELTCGVAEDEDDSSGDEKPMDDSNGPAGKKSRSTKSLHRLVSQQVTELDEVRELLAAADATTLIRQTQLEMWKRRAESNPSQLDDMLTESTNKNELLEKSLMSLRNELETKEKDRVTQQNEADQRIESVQTEMTTAKEEGVEALQEYNTMRGELEALSNAYSSLEAEYNRSCRSTTKMQHQQPFVETAEATSSSFPQQQQAQGEPSGVKSEGGTTSSSSAHQPPLGATNQDEVSSLQSENARLRNDAVAADEWMAMAVQRMNDMTGQTTVLQQEVFTLKQQQMGLSESAIEPVASAGEIHEEQVSRQELEKDLANARNDVTSTLDSLSKSKSEKDELLSKLDTVSKELEKAQSEIASLQDGNIQHKKQQEHASAKGQAALEQYSAERDVMITAKEQEIAFLKNEIESINRNNKNSENSDELNSLRKYVETLRNEVATCQKEMEDALKRHSEEIANRDAAIFDLEALLAQVKNKSSEQILGLGADDANIKERDQEIEKLNASNDAAQQWMAKAVEHHQKLTEQVSALNTDKTVLIKEVAEVRASAATDLEIVESTSNELSAKTIQLEATIAQESRKREAIAGELESARQQLEQKESELYTHCASSSEEVASSRELEINFDKVRQELATAKEENDSLRAQCDNHQGTLEIAQESRKREAIAGELESARQQLEQKESELYTHCASSSEEVHALKTGIYEREQTIGKTSREVASSRELEINFDKVRQELATAKEENDSLRAQCDNHQGTLEDANAKLADSLAQTDATQKQITDTEFEKEKVADDLQLLIKEHTKQSEELTALRKELDSEVESLTKERTEIEAGKSELASRVEHLNVENANLETRHSSMEQNVKVLEKRVEDLGIILQDTENIVTQLRDKEEYIGGVEDTLSKTRKGFEEVQVQSEYAVQQLQERVAELESASKDLEQQLEEQSMEATDTIMKWEKRYSEVSTIRQEGESNKYTQLEEQLKNKEDAIVEAEESLIAAQKQLEEVGEHSENAAKRWKEHIQRLEAELVQQTKEATRLTSEWEIRCNEVTEEHTILSKELEDRENALAEDEKVLNLARAEAKEIQNRPENAVGQWKDRTEDLELSVKDLEQELVTQQQEASDAITLWERRCTDLDEKILKLESEIDGAKKEHNGLSKSLQETTQNLDKENDRFKLLKVGLTEKEDIILSLQSEVKVKTEEFNTSHETFISEKGSLVATQKELENALEEERKALATAKAESNELSKGLKEVQKEGVEVVNQWKERYEEVEEVNAELDQEIEQQQEEATHAISQWEMRCSQLEEDNEDNVASNLQSLQQLESDLKSEMAFRGKADAALATEIEKTGKLERALTHMKEERTKGELESTRTEKGRTEEELKSSMNLANVVKMQLKEERDGREEERSSLQQERVVLNVLIAELQEELKETSDALLSCVTDEVSHKATEMATQALRVELDEMRKRLETDRGAYANERRCRRSAELEVKQLKSDLAILLPVGQEEADTTNMAFKASERLQRKERKEMEELRKTLEKALQDVSSARAAEKENAERAAASRLQASVCEQEVISSKADAKYLSQTMKEMREAEASRRASLEYRISALEDDRAILTRFHADELDNLRNELSHLMMEKDRTLLSLRETEKANDSLTHLISNEEGDTCYQSPAEELVRLRVGRAQLLATAEEDACKTERRIKEAVAAQASSVEADVILERELRSAAEAIADDMRQQLEEFQDREHLSEKVVAGVDHIEFSTNSATYDQLKGDVDRIRAEAKKLSEENAILRDQAVQMDINSAKSKADTLELSEHYRKAQAKLHKVEREGLFDAEVTAEIARLRADAARISAHSCFDSNKENSSDSWNFVSQNSIEECREPVKEGISTAEAFNYVQKQSIAIKEERAMYYELLVEHDDLLALLAQQDLEKASLLDALEKAAGEDAVEAAIREAQQSAVKEFGKYVKLSQLD